MRKNKIALGCPTNDFSNFLDILYPTNLAVWEETGLFQTATQSQENRSLGDRVFAPTDVDARTELKGAERESQKYCRLCHRGLPKTFGTQGPRDVFQPPTPGIPAPNDVELVECFHIGLQGT